MTADITDADRDRTLLLPPPQRDRERFVVPVALYGCNAQLRLPCDMTELEARKLANVILAFGKVTSHRPSRPRPYRKDEV